MTNNFYDNTETISLKMREMTVEGEIANPGPVDFSKLSLHSVIVKETLLDNSGGDRFTGAYRYDGYSLFDILDARIIKKDPQNAFGPVIDLYVEIENDKGEKVDFSWGEIYYPVNLHHIIIATGVSRIVPSRTNDLWPLPEESKIVAGCDLVTERNISGPVKITVKSIKKSFPLVKGMAPMYYADVNLFLDNNSLGKLPDDGRQENVNYNTVFYGRGRGIHSTSPFKGLLLKDILDDYYPVSRYNLQEGMFCMSGLDGYHCAVSYSELFNRNDQQEFLMVKTEKNEDGGLYRLFSSADFFSDRAIKSLTEITLAH